MEFPPPHERPTKGCALRGGSAPPCLDLEASLLLLVNKGICVAMLLLTSIWIDSSSSLSTHHIYVISQI